MKTGAAFAAFVIFFSGTIKKWYRSFDNLVNQQKFTFVATLSLPDTKECIAEREFCALGTNQAADLAIEQAQHPTSTHCGALLRYGASSVLKRRQTCLIKSLHTISVMMMSLDSSETHL